MTELAHYFRAQADWRERKAEEYPDDARNAQSAAALRSLAEFVESDEVEAARAREALEPHLSQGLSLGGERAQRAVSRYGYGYPVSVGSHEEFVDELAQLCAEDAYESVGEGNDDPSGTLDEFEIEAARDGVDLGPHYFRRRAGMLPHELEAWVEESRAAGGGER